MARDDMSHSVTVTRTTHTTTTSAILLNTGYFKTYPGLLKTFQLLIGAVVVGITAYYGSNYYHNFVFSSPEIFFCIIAVTCLTATACLLLSCILSISTASILPKTIFEVIYHSVAFILYLAASINFLVEVNRLKKHYSSQYEPYLAAAEMVFGAVATILMLSASLNTLQRIKGRNAGYEVVEKGYSAKIFASILGLINTVLYLLSTALAYRSYKGK